MPAEKSDIEDIDILGKSPIVEEPFDEFCKKYSCVREVMKTKEWRDIYSHYYDFDEYEQDIVFDDDEAVDRYTPQQQMDEYVKCANSFYYFCTKYVRIAHPIRGLVRFFVFKYQRKVISAYDNHRWTILSKFRQGGLSTVSAIWALWLCMFRVDQRIMIVSKTDREAIGVGEMARLAMDYLPEWLKPEMGKSNEHERRFKDTDSVLWCYTVEAARSKSITVLIIDEAAFIDDMDKHWRSLAPVLSTGGKCCVISTVNGVGNWYHEKYVEAENGDNKFHIVDMDYWEHPEYNNPKWVEDQKANMGEKGWAQEVLRSFLGSGETFISTKIIESLIKHTEESKPARFAFEKWVNKSNKDKKKEENGALWIWREPVAGREYILSADCSEGVGEQGDNNCFELLDLSTLEQVAEFYSNAIPPHLFAQVIHSIGIYYNNALVVVENMNQGGTVLSNLQHNLGYENLYYDTKGRQDAPGLKTGKNNRPAFLESLQDKLMNKQVRVNSRRLVGELQTFIFNPRSKKPEANKGGHDDAVMALSMALYVSDSMKRDQPVGVGKRFDLPEVLKSEAYEDIKKEILLGTGEDWAMQDPNQTFVMNGEGQMSSLTALMRKRDSILKEFGW